MAKAIFTTLVLLCNSIAASAQPSGNYGYVFGGAATLAVKPQRGGPSQPRPKAWVRRHTHFQVPALKGRANRQGMAG